MTLTPRSLTQDDKVFAAKHQSLRGLRVRSRAVRASAHPRGRFSPDDVPQRQAYLEEIITFIGADGVTRIPGRLITTTEPVPALVQQPLPTWEEQGLCIGASFQVAATNGVDPARRINFEGFCQSVDVLAECVEHAVARQGGDVMLHETTVKSGMHQCLRLIVAVPLLWGLSPKLETLSDAIETGGGIVDRIYKQWGMY